MPNMPTALIAEDEPLLAAALQAELRSAWPALQVCAVAANGLQAVELALQHQPQVLFFDIQMPGQSGLDAAAQLADAWPDAASFPALVFVTAFDQYAVQAFEQQALDYVLKPVQAARLAQTVARVQERLAKAVPVNFEALNLLLKAATGQQNIAQAATQTIASTTPKLTTLQASRGSQIDFVPLADVLYFEAADKYVRVLTAQHEYLIRTPIKELLAQLDEAQFWQIHRGTVVRVSDIASVLRSEDGKLHLRLRSRSEKLAVSRLYAHLFKAM
jgi:DNA-binding LytR/AlgR family response regulator